MLFILFVVVAELRARANMRHQSARPALKNSLVKLSPIQKITASSFCWLLVIAGFLSE